MTPITRQDILAHQAVVPWAAQYQVEQDLLLCRAMVALFDDKFLSSQIAMRGGTLLHKVHLAPPARYSEDIDLVVVALARQTTFAGPSVACLPMFLELQKHPFGTHSHWRSATPSSRRACCE